jgi:hypothetical protein
VSTNDNSVEKTTQSFNAVFEHVTDNLGIQSQVQNTGISFSSSLKKNLKWKKRLDKKWTALIQAGKAVPDLLVTKHLRATTSYRKAKREWKVKQCNIFYQTISDDTAAHDNKNVWRRITSTIGNNIHKSSKGRGLAFYPILDPKTNESITDLPGVLRIHADYYKNLATYNGDSHLNNWEKWMDIGPAELPPVLEGINDPIYYVEILTAIRQINRNTALGVDEIHINVLKALVVEEGWAEFLIQNPELSRPDWIRKDVKVSDLPNTLRTNLGKALYKLLTLIWNKAQLDNS